MKQIILITLQHKSVNARDGESGRGIGGNRHLESFRESRRIEHRRCRINVNRSALNDAKAGRRVQPGVGDNDENTGKYAECASNLKRVTGRLLP